MNFLEKLDYQMNCLGINKRNLSIMSDVPYTTIDGFYKKGYENAKISTIRKIAKALDVSLDYLIDDAPMEKEKSPSFSDEELEILEKYNSLDARDQGRVLGYIDRMLEDAKYQKESSLKNA